MTTLTMENVLLRKPRAKTSSATGAYPYTKCYLWCLRSTTVVVSQLFELHTFLFFGAKKL